MNKFVYDAMVHSDKKVMHVHVAPSVQKGRIKYTVAPVALKEAHRPKFKF